ncbi:eCIS core domain-containing protein [Roseivirga thermotolerans]|uniref:eCIS core domain-containing protein n=1 Tax=Roseivirga thermotolerans TaxID=1758176 RepID=UPI00273E6B54|nr:DUF4157 domain-containing protein [Roseivirga thermotolerans]
MQESSKKYNSCPEMMNRQAVAQRKGKEGTSLEPPVQKKSNLTGLPDQLKTGIENLSGHSMDDVKVHYNSSKPAQLQAHAYAQGNQIHLAPGQEKHLPHEAWHVVQQKQGRVKPTMQFQHKVNINDDAGLEKEADVMGEKASGNSNMKHQYQLRLTAGSNFNSASIAQPKVNVSLKTNNSDNNDSEYFVRFLGSGSYGSAYETSKNNVAKIGSIRANTVKIMNSDGLEIDPEYQANQNPKGLNEAKENSLEKEYHLMEEIHNKAPHGFIAQPLFLGKISVQKGVEPTAFDNDVSTGQLAIVMEKVKVLNILKPEKTMKSEDLKVDHFNSIKKEIKTFTELMELRWKFIALGYLHKDIKHNNAGYDDKSNLKAIDLGMTDKIGSGYHNKVDEKLIDQMVPSYANGTVFNDVVRSYSITLSNILAHFGISKSDNNLVPESLRNILKGLILRENRESFSDMSKYIDVKLEPATIEYIKAVVKEEINPKIWRKPQEESISERLSNQESD